MTSARGALRAITRKDALRGMAAYDRGETGDFGHATRYHLVHGGRRYPPKAVVGLASQRPLGRPLSHDEFSGGNGRWQANGVLRALGFDVEAFRPIDGPQERVATSGTDWTDAEIGVAIASYFEMLRLHLGGHAIVKRDFVKRALHQMPGRTRGALEFKFENISAVLDRLELRWLEGYRPAQNYQHRLEDAVLDVLVDDPELAKALGGVEAVAPAPPSALATDDVVVEPPTADAMQRDSGGRQHLVRGGWVAGRDEANKRLGTDGERWVVELEREKLSRAGRDDLANAVDHVALRVDGLGYDVISFEPNSEPLHIEVKTTRSSRRTPFVLTPNEIRVSGTERSIYRLYRVFDFGPEARVYILRGDLETQVELTPTHYSARPR